MTDFDLLVLGDCNADVVLQGASVEPVFGQAERLAERGSLTIGGSGAIAACGAARLGLRTALVAVIGDDPVGRLTLEAVAGRGVDVSRCIVERERPTGVTVVLSRGSDRAIVTAPGTTSNLRADRIEMDILRACRHVHVSSYFLQTGLQPALPRLLSEARSAGASTSVDPNWDPRGEWNGGLGRALAPMDFFLPNGEEVRRIARRMAAPDRPEEPASEPTSEPDASTAAAQIAGRDGPTIAVKLGPEGALLRGPGAEEIRVPAVRLTAPMVDTTGAGDSFDAGFLTGVLGQWPLRDAMRLACACGALSTRALGGTDAQPTMVEALDAMRIDP